IAATLLLSSCGTMGNSGMGLGSLPSNGGNLAGTSTGSTQTGNTAGKVIESLIGNLLNSSATLSQKDLTGTWQYVGADCAFKSENFLMKAGGEVAAAKIEEQLNTNLAKVGIKSGTCSFTFKEDNTYSAKIGGRSISGNYTINAQEKTIKMTYLGGIGTMTPHVIKTGRKISLMFESDKLLKLVSAVSALSGSTAVQSLGTIAQSYDGMYIGMQLSK
ncbi:MAG: DUF4923 family protein, partial [Bacteroidaceae bacterium]|nr:DUF4923 family protein [Bacteroidaceae bacterium]